MRKYLAIAAVYGTYRITPDTVAHLMLNYGFNHGLGSSLTIDASGSIKTGICCDGGSRSISSPVISNR